MPVERLQKVLARAGVASRRAAEELIRSGRVRVDGEIVTELGTQVDGMRARIEVDGKRVVRERPVYLVFHKPKSVMCTLRDPEGRPTVQHYFRGLGSRVVPVGRLDFHTSGVLLMTNDGEFSEGLSHPSKGTAKVYVAKLNRAVGDAELEQLRQSIVIDGRATRGADVRHLRVEGGKSWVELVLREGRNRQVRRLVEAAGLSVMRLARTSFADVTSDGLRPGQWRHLTRDELVKLKKGHGVPKKIIKPPSELLPVHDGMASGASNAKPRARGGRRTTARATNRATAKPGGAKPRGRGSRRK